MKTKQCSSCKQIKDLALFNKNKAKKDGFSHYCKECEHEARRKSQATTNLTAKNRYKRYLSSEKGKETRRKYYAKSKQNNTWKTYERNLEQHRYTMLKRRAMLAKNGVYLILDKELKRLQTSNCFYCGEAANTIDHIIAVSRGGAHSVGNLVACCKSCNSSKNNKTIMEWRKTKKTPILT